MLDKNKKILIVGLGLIGGSYAEGLTNNGYYVGCITRSASSIEYALDKGIIKEGTTEIKEEMIKKYDLIIFALYPKVFINWLENYQSFIKEGAIITDVTGVKESVVTKINSFLRKDIDFVPHHPMAGKETYGVKNSDAAIFKKANFIICYNDNKQESLGAIESIGKILEFRRISYLTLKEHDEMIGFLSQLTHCIAVVLMNAKDSEKLVDYTGDSFRDLTRIAKINEEMWTELFLLNKVALLKEMDSFINEFMKLRNAIQNDDEEAIKEMMKLSTLRRSYFDK